MDAKYHRTSPVVLSEIACNLWPLSNKLLRGIDAEDFGGIRTKMLVETAKNVENGTIGETNYICNGECKARVYYGKVLEDSCGAITVFTARQSTIIQAREDYSDTCPTEANCTHSEGKL